MWGVTSNGGVLSRSGLFHICDLIPCVQESLRMHIRQSNRIGDPLDSIVAGVVLAMLNLGYDGGRDLCTTCHFPARQARV